MGYLDVLDRKKTPARPFRWPVLPDLTLEAARIEAQLFRPSASVRHKIAGKTVTLTGPTKAAEGPMVVAEVVIGRHAVRVCAPEDVLGTLLALHDIEDDWCGYDPGTAALVTEHLMAEATVALEAILGGTLRVESLTPAPKKLAGPALHLDIAVGLDQTIPITLFADPDLLAQLLRMIGDEEDIDAAPLADLDNLAFAVKLMGPAFTAAAKDVALSRIGDGFFLEKDWSGLFITDVIVAGHLAAKARLADDGFRLTSDLSRHDKPNSGKEATMSFKSGTDDSDTATLPVTMRIELAETTMTLAEVRAMAAGSLLPFAQDLPTTVSLTANGKPFARGDLVRIEGKIAVRLTELC
jgi:type III secretion system YscQ/HrcQ family protein